MRSIFWDDQLQQLRLIDQTLLPARYETITLSDHQQVADAIQRMVVRGAPAIGVAAAFGMALAARNTQTSTVSALIVELQQAAQTLKAARPTAVNLAWAVDQLLSEAEAAQGSLADLQEQLLAMAKRLADEDVAINKAMATYGAELIHDGDRIVHHCNTGALATVDYGTALGVIRMAHEQGKKIHVFVDETRPRLQGARLTAWELSQYGIPYDIIADGASGYLVRSGEVDQVLFGADRMAANGDVANKIGTYMLALAAYDNGIPAYAVLPTSTIDLSIHSGEQIEIEERDPSEVLDLKIHKQQVAPAGATARNPAFDVTPHRLLAGIITEKGVVYPPFFRTLPNLKAS